MVNHTHSDSMDNISGGATLSRSDNALTSTWWFGTRVPHLRFPQPLLKLLSCERFMLFQTEARMAPTPRYQVYNRRQQGLAETTRLILESAGADYENVFVEVLALVDACFPITRSLYLTVA
jgi:hypothetical protein